MLKVINISTDDFGASLGEIKESWSDKNLKVYVLKADKPIDDVRAFL